MEVPQNATQFLPKTSQQLPCKQMVTMGATNLASAYDFLTYY